MYTSLNCSHCSISIALPFPPPKGNEFIGVCDQVSTAIMNHFLFSHELLTEITAHEIRTFTYLAKLTPFYFFSTHRYCPRV